MYFFPLSAAPVPVSWSQNEIFVYISFDAPPSEDAGEKKHSISFTRDACHIRSAGRSAMYVVHVQSNCTTNAGHNIPGIASQFATQNPCFAMRCCIVQQNMCKSCMRHTRVIMQAVEWVIEIATQEI